MKPSTSAAQKKTESCYRCGKSNAKGFNFCDFCGTRRQREGQQDNASPVIPLSVDAPTITTQPSAPPPSQPLPPVEQHRGHSVCERVSDGKWKSKGYSSALVLLVIVFGILGPAMLIGGLAALLFIPFIIHAFFAVGAAFTLVAFIIGLASKVYVTEFNDFRLSVSHRSSPVLLYYFNKCKRANVFSYDDILNVDYRSTCCTVNGMPLCFIYFTTRQCGRVCVDTTTDGYNRKEEWRAFVNARREGVCY